MESDGRLLPGELAAAVQEAQARLLRMRAEQGIKPKTSALSPWETAEGAGDADVASAPNWLLLNAQKDLQRRRGAIHCSPPCQGNTPTAPANLLADPAPIPANEARTTSLTACARQTVVVHPTILMATLRQDLEAPARVWLLLRAIDRDGRGWLDVEEARHHLTGKDAFLQICGWRRLRQILRQGEGIFWNRYHKNRLWLRGARRIAYQLDSGWLQGFPVELPLETLLGGIQNVRAAFYAAFHSGRKENPISRDTLATISGIPGRTQLEYDRVAGVVCQRNIAIGERYTVENAQERAWQHGRGVFHFIDTEGRQGRAGREYVAWHLPNSYRANYQRRSRGSRKRLNRELADLVNKRTPGNDGQVAERLFFPNGALAARRYNRAPEQDAYWRQEDVPRAARSLWYVISRREG